MASFVVKCCTYCRKMLHSCNIRYNIYLPFLTQTMTGRDERTVADKGVETCHEESSNDGSCSVMVGSKIMDSESDEDDDESIDEEPGCGLG